MQLALQHQQRALSSSKGCSTSGRRQALCAAPRGGVATMRRAAPAPPRAHKVELDVFGTMHVLEVDENTTILQAALDAGLEARVPHDCRMGVCLACASRITGGEVDQGGGMINEQAADKGYALLCVAYPQTDVAVSAIPQEELMDEVMATAKAAQNAAPIA
eukprot:scaffold14.g1228.t1